MKPLDIETLRSDAYLIFNAANADQKIGDVIEWYHSSLSVALSAIEHSRTQVQVSDEREAFEKAARQEGCGDFRRVGDAYADRRTLRCWRIWQKALALHQAHTADIESEWARMSQDEGKAEREIGRLQAHIDALMLEFCPDEMTPQQKANWAAHQVRSDVPEFNLGNTAQATAAQGEQNDGDRYRKLRRWMTSNVAEGWAEVEKLAAIGCYLGWTDFDATLDALPECRLGLVSTSPTDNRIVGINAQPAPVAPTCPTCGGTGHVDDGEITGEGGVQFSNGPIKCVKDCPTCASQPAQAAQGEPVAWRYELATYFPHDARGQQWRWHMTDYKPSVPESMIRNLHPLVYGDTQPAPVVADADPLQGAANWIAQALSGHTTDIQQRLAIGYNRASRLCEVAMAAAQRGGA